MALSGQLLASNISGYVADSSSGETIIGVNILVVGEGVGAVSDANGFFNISGLRDGTYIVRFSHIAYEMLDYPITLTGADQFVETVRLEPTVIQTQAVEVTGSGSNLIEKDTDIASFEVNPVVLREVPQLGRDVYKLVTFSPSVARSDPFSPLYSVRGSDPGENLIQLDGMTIYNPQHTMSATAVFNPYAIKNVELLVGGFDASHGGRNSSILYLTSREGHQSDIQGEFKPSTSGIVGAIEFPVKYGGTAMVSGRALSSLVSRIVMGMPNLMLDFNGAYLLQWERSRLRLSTFYARDLVDYDFARLGVYFDDPIFQSYSTGFLTKTRNMASGIQFRTVLTPSLVFNSHVYYSGFKVTNETFFKMDFVLEEDSTYHVVLNYDTRVQNSISDLTLKSNLTYYTFWNQSLELGMEQNRYRFFNSAGVGLSAASEAESIANLTSVYLQDKLELGPVVLKAGVRTAQLSGGSDLTLEPRASLAIRIGEVMVKAAAGRYNQYITALNTQDFEMSQFIDYYYPITDKDPISARHYILGIEGKLLPSLDYGISAYYKALDRLYRFDYINTLESVLNYTANLEKGHGESYGLEMSISGSYGRLSGWGSYTLSRSTRSFPSIQNGEDYLADSDRTHSLKALVIYGLTEDITASATLKFSSGSPHTWAYDNADHFSYNPAEDYIGFYPIPITPVKNNVRYPSILNLDIGWKKRLRAGFGHRLAEYLGTDQAYFTVAITNILFLHRNPMFYFTIPDYGNYAYDPMLFPTASLGYSIKF
jgi:hypothetical protein